MNDLPDPMKLVMVLMGSLPAKIEQTLKMSQIYFVEILVEIYVMVHFCLASSHIIKFYMPSKDKEKILFVDELTQTAWSTKYKIVDLA
jgi:hypothetical protein